MPAAASAAILAVLVVYLAVLAAIGVWAGRGSRTMVGYYLADKRLPAWVIAFSSNATGESAWLLLGLTGMGYTLGAHALWIALGEVLGVAGGWLLVARPFKRESDRYDAITVPDYLEARFGDRHHVFRWLGMVIVVTMVTAYTAAQLTASGKAFASFLGTSYATGAVVGAIVILWYTTVGGFKAVAYTDLLQGLLMFGGLAVLPLVGLFAAGGPAATLEALQRIDPDLLRLMGPYGWTLPGVVSAIGFVGIGLAFLGAPQLLARFMSARDEREIRRAGPIAVLCVLVFDLGAIVSGMTGRVLFDGLNDPETILPVMSAELLAPVFTGIFMVTVLAAIMSTVDSLLILASASVVRDVVQRVFQPHLTEARLSLYGKLTTVVIGVAALVLALEQVRVVFWFVLFAWSGLACAFTPVVLCALFWQRTTRAGAIAGMLAGFLTAVIWVLLPTSVTLGLYEMIPGFVAGFAVTILVSLATRTAKD